MAEEIVRHRWCDVHMGRGEREPGQARVITVDGRKPRKLDLCEVCDKELLGPLLELLEEAPIAREGATAGGVLPDGDTNKRTRLDCPVCAEEGGSHIVFARSSMRNHFEEQHDIGLIEWETQNGATVDGKPLKFECDFPGCGLKFTHAQGMGAHKRSVHEVEGTSDTAVKRQRKPVAKKATAAT